MCEFCGGYLDYGYNCALYCNCSCFSGKGTLLENFEFRCKDVNHGFNFVNYNALYNVCSGPIIPFENITILVLGQMNVGKTTFIKSMISVLAFGDFEAAQKIKNLRNAEISTTVDCQLYSIRYKNYNLQLIDTPGFGRGVEDDANSVREILDYIRDFDRIHGICVILKSHEPEINIPTFQFCNKEILGLLHKNLTNNVVFCSTFIPSVSSKPGNTLAMLEHILAENKLLDKKMFYSFDIEFYDYFLKRSIDDDDFCGYEPEETNIYKKGWDATVNETARLLNFVCSLEPQDVKETLSLNESRNMIDNLMGPISCALGDTEKSIKTVQSVQNIIQNFNEINVGNCYSNVCTDECCVQYVEHYQEDDPWESKCNCSGACSLTGILDQVLDNENKCSWKTHVCIFCIQERTEIQVKNQDFELIVRSKGNSKIGDVSDDLEKYVTRLKKEKEKMVDTCRKFGNYLKSHAVLAVNDSYYEYLDDWACRSGNITLSKELESMKTYNTEIIELINREMTNSPISNDGDQSDLNKWKEELFSLPVYGRKIRADVLLNTGNNISNNCQKNSKGFIDPHLKIP